MHDAGTSCLAKLQIRTPSTPRRINLSIPAFVPRTDATSLLSAQSGPARCVRRCPLSGVKRTWVGHVYDARSSFCPSPQNAKERKLHEHERYLSRCFPWQQNQPKNDSMELSSRRGTAGKGTAGNGRLEGMGRKAPGRDRRHGWTTR